MTTTVRCRCPLCGEVEMLPDAITLTVCDDVPARSTYAFVCPRCAVTIRKPACADAISMLVQAGVPAAELIIPAEALEQHDGPALTYDDVLDFMHAIRAAEHPAESAASA